MKATIVLVTMLTLAGCGLNAASAATANVATPASFRQASEAS